MVKINGYKVSKYFNTYDNKDCKDDFVSKFISCVYVLYRPKGKVWSQSCNEFTAIFICYDKDGNEKVYEYNKSRHCLGLHLNSNEELVMDKFCREHKVDKDCVCTVKRIKVVRKCKKYGREYIDIPVLKIKE